MQVTLKLFSFSETNNLHTVVYEISVNDKQLTKVDEIPSTGVQVLEVFWTTKGIILVVGNSFDSERFTDSVNSGVYRFNEYKNKVGRKISSRLHVG